MNRLLNAWLIGSKRSLSQWKLLTSVVLGVILACTIISSSFIYLDSLEEIALNLALDDVPDQEHDLILQTKAGPVSQSQYDLLNSTASKQLSSHIGNLEQDRFSAIKSPTFFLTELGFESAAEEKVKVGARMITLPAFSKVKDRAYFVSLPSLNENIKILSGSSEIPEYYPFFDEKNLYLGALISNTSAELFSLKVGDQMIAFPTWSDKYESIVVEISGIFERKPSGENIWYLEETVLGASTASA
ncbi:uncharacterized protein METZ01_LOCUS249934, partial [marine metagenome]